MRIVACSLIGDGSFCWDDGNTDGDGVSLSVCPESSKNDALLGMSIYSGMLWKIWSSSI
jgi:hypothetical protein